MFGLNGTVSKYALTHLASVELVQIKAALAAAAMLGYLAITRPTALRLDRRALLPVLAGGVVGIAVLHVLYYAAIARLPVGVALLLQLLAPLLIVIWLRVVRHVQVGPAMWLALALCVGGLTMVTQVWQGLTIDGIGVLAGLASAVALAAYYLISERSVATVDTLAVAGYSLVAAAAFWLVARPPWRFPWAKLAEPVGIDRLSLSIPLWAVIAWTSLAGTVAAYILVLRSVRRIGPGRAGLIGMVEPVVAAPIAWWLLGERLTPFQWAGGAIVLGGIFFAEWARRQVTGGAP